MALQKFIFKFLLAFAGVCLYILHDGTLAKAIVIYLFAAAVMFFSTVGYHRWVTHNAVDATLLGKFVFYFSMISINLINPISYAIIHRTHHKYSDTDKDPHGTALGFWNVLVGNYSTIKLAVPVRDLYRKKDLVFIDRYYYRLHILVLAIFALIDIDLFLLSFAFIPFQYHIRNGIFNYIAHGGSKVSGPQNLSSLLRLGEQLHKNHHDNPGNGYYGRVSALNFDIGYYILRGLFLIK
jgi:stearoyl-CoA desaturase (delta-9 desaturase)